MDPKQFGHIGVLMGGYSSEREISLKSGKAVFTALEQCGCRVSAVDIVSNDESEIIKQLKDAKLDAAFIALHGHLGEDGAIQSILGKLNIPYAGSGVEASRLALNKISSQNLFRKNQIPVADFTVVSKNDAAARQKAANEIKTFPVVVKPASQGSSIGITLVEKKEDLSAALDDAFRYDNEVLIEKYIKGRELTVGILDKTALPVIEIIPKARFFDFAAKYQTGTTQYVIPAKIPAKIASNIQKIALAAHQALGCRDISRVDVMLDDDENPFVLEINTVPGFTAMSLLPKAAKAQGIDFPELCLRLIFLAYARKQNPQESLVT